MTATLLSDARATTLTAETRDESLRACYANAVLAAIPRIIGSLDRNPFRPTFGCFDRQFWHYRTAAFPSEMYQEAVLPLAWAFVRDVPANRWFQQEAVREWVVAALRYSACKGRRDGSCDDYYPYERALGAAVFSLAACARAYELLDLHDGEILEGLKRRARWIAGHDEPGRLTNHHALAAVALARVARLVHDARLYAAAEHRVERVLAWQHAEGWFDEYGGADPGYQTVTIDCLATYQSIRGGAELAEPLRRAVAFCRCFLHPDGSYGGEYGSRGTYHFYPHGFELLTEHNSAAADLADAFLHSLRDGMCAYFDDDRLYAHRLANLCEAYDDWSPLRASAQVAETFVTRHFPVAGLLSVRSCSAQTIVSTARGGVFKHFCAGKVPGAGSVSARSGPTADCPKPCVTDGGIVVQLVNGCIGVSNHHDRSTAAEYTQGRKHDDGTSWRIVTRRRLREARWETATPLKQAVFHIGMVTLGRFARGLVRRLLQRRVIRVGRELPIVHTRTMKLLVAEGAGLDASHSLRVTDSIELHSRRVHVRRMAYGVDHQPAYTAATAVYQDSVRQAWTDLAEHIEVLNRDRRVTIVREFPA